MKIFHRIFCKIFNRHQPHIHTFIENKEGYNGYNELRDRTTYIEKSIFTCPSCSSRYVKVYNIYDRSWEYRKWEYKEGDTIEIYLSRAEIHEKKRRDRLNGLK